MNQKLTVNSYIRIIIFSLFIPFFLTVSKLVLDFERIFSIPGIGNVPRYGFETVTDSLWITVCLVVIPFCLKNIYKTAVTDNVEKDKFADMAVRDLEKQEKLIERFTNMYNDLVEYDRQKTNFFTNLCHELKTPITIIMGAIQLTELSAPTGHSSLPEKQARLVRTIKQNCFRLLRLINNILDITRSDSDYIKLNPVNCNIVYLVEEIVQSVVPYAQQKNLTLKFDTEAEEIETSVDIDKMERIVLNLLSNAIKFTPSEGRIDVTMGLKNGMISLSVRDTGLGIPQNMQSVIFERFRQLDNNFTKSYEGSGLGLSIVKSFVELHGGTIKVISEEGNGSEFLIEMPVQFCKNCCTQSTSTKNNQSRIIDTLNIEFSDIYTNAS